VTIEQTDEDLDLIERGDDEEERSGYRAEPWWYLKNEGDTAILRFLEESAEWRKVPTHRFFPTKPEPEKFEGNWPKAMPATCRGGRLVRKYPDGCPMCTSGYEGPFKKGSKPEDVRYTVAVERERYEDENGRARFRDKEIEVPLWNRETGEVSETETMTLPSLVLVGETMYRMMSALKGTGEATGSLRSQDIRLKLIKNPGNGKGLIISPVAMAPDATILPGTEHWELYEMAMGLWKPRGLNLEREILYRASPTWWNKFFLMEDGRTHAEHVVRRGGNPGASTASTGNAQATARTPQHPDSERQAAQRARNSRHTRN
jgi:hypothetical protein